jgi:hypothetical protein
LVQDENKEIDWQHTLQLARESGSLRSLLLGAALSHFLCNIPISEVVQDQWERDPSLAFLIRQSFYFFDHPFSDPKTFDQAIRQNLFLLRLISGPAQIISFLIDKALPGAERPDPLPIPIPIYFMVKPFLKLHYFLRGVLAKHANA